MKVSNASLRRSPCSLSDKAGIAMPVESTVESIGCIGCASLLSAGVSALPMSASSIPSLCPCQEQRGSNGTFIGIVLGPQPGCHAVPLAPASGIPQLRTGRAAPRQSRSTRGPRPWWRPEAVASQHVRRHRSVLPSLRKRRPCSALLTLPGGRAGADRARRRCAHSPARAPARSPRWPGVPWLFG